MEKTTVKKRWCVVAVLGALAWSVVAASESAAAPLEDRCVYLPTNLLVDKNIDDGLAILRRASQAGYNGVVLADSKFMRWDQLPKRYATNVDRFRQAIRSLKLKCIACVCPIGYSNELLSRDPNLAEGLPARDVPFVARDGKLVGADDAVRIVNGGFEQSKRNVPAGWSFVDQPGKISFIDSEVKCEGRCSLRMEDIGLHDPAHGNGRVCQKIAVRPFHYYHVAVTVKTENFETPGQVHVSVIAPGGTMLNYCEPRIERTQPWKQVDITFNSLEFSEVVLYLGVWGGRRGKIWWDDVRIEPAGLVNVVRRDGAPLRATSADGQTAYVEGRDFQGAADPKLGTVPYRGEFSVWHEPPVMTLPADTRIRSGDKVLMSYYHTAIIYQGQVMCCMAEPKVYEILRWQIQQVHRHLAPDGYFFEHDEIRVQGWDESCRNTGKTPGELLSENVRKCVELVRAEDAGKPIYVWSDMFDPYHNARKSGRYYLVKGDGPWFGSWKGLDKDVVIVNWNSAPAHRGDSLRHFSGLGQRQILAGYYDGPVDAIRGWLKDSQQAPGVIGVMYTTWRHQYADLERFAAALGPAPTRAPATAAPPVFPRATAAGLPVFYHRGVVLDYEKLKYNPCNVVIIPSVVRVDHYFDKPLGRYSMYYAPHNPPGGICLAYADRLEGPWKEYGANPLIARDWPPHYKVSHVSGPHAIWIEEERKLFVYYHGENDVTRFASTSDGVHFHYEGVAFTTKMFPDVSEASYARMFRYTLPGKDNRYIALLMGNNRGTRRIYLAWSKDGRRWEPRQTPLVDPPPGTAQVAQAWFLPWQGKHYLIYHAHWAVNPLIVDLHVSEVDPALEQSKYLGLFYDHASAGPGNVAQMSPCIVEGQGKLYLFTNIGPRLNQKIALATADVQDGPHP